MAVDFKAMLAQAKEKSDELVNAAKTGGFNEIADGVYVFRWTGAELRESNSGKPQAVFSHTIQEGEEQGQIKRVFRNLDTEEGLAWFLRELQSYGVDIESWDWDETEAFFEEINECSTEDAVYFRARLQTPRNSDFQNIKILTLLTGEYTPDEIDDNESPADPEPVKAPAKTSAKAPATPAKTPAPAAKAPAAKAPKETPAEKKKREKEEAEAARLAEEEAAAEAEENEETEDEDEGVEIKKGMKLKFTNEAGKEMQGIVTTFTDDTVDLKVGLKTYKGISVEDCELVD